MKRLLFPLLLLAFVIALFSGATALNPFALSAIEQEILLGLRLPRVQGGADGHSAGGTQRCHVCEP